MGFAYLHHAVAQWIEQILTELTEPFFDHLQDEPDAAALSSLWP